MIKYEGETPVMTMFDALVHERIQEAGGFTLYAEKLRINPSTLYRWVSLEINPLSGQETPEKQRLCDDLAIPKAGLEQLAGLTVNEACVLLMENPELTSRE